jgi:hypothetical protein
VVVDSENSCYVHTWRAEPNLENTDPLGNHVSAGMVESKSDDRVFRLKEKLVGSSLRTVRVHVMRTLGVAHASPQA